MYLRKNNLNRTVILNNVNVLDINSFALVWDDEKLQVYINESFVSEVTLTDTFSANILNNLKFEQG